MTKQKPATTNKLVIHYNNCASYTIPRVTGFTVAQDGKSVSGSYTKTVKFHGITQQHNIDFKIDLVDVVGMSYEGKEGEMSKVFEVSSGRITSVTEFRTEDDYYKPAGCLIKSRLQHQGKVFLRDFGVWGDA